MTEMLRAGKIAHLDSVPSLMAKGIRVPAWTTLHCRQFQCCGIFPCLPASVFLDLEKLPLGWQNTYNKIKN